MTYSDEHDWHSDDIVEDAPRRIPLSLKILACIGVLAAIVGLACVAELAGVDLAAEAPWGAR